MKDRLCLKKKRRRQGGTRIIFGIFVFITLALFTSQASAQIEMELFGKDLTLSGYVNQGVQFGVAGDHWDTKSGFQQALMQILLEIEYHPADNVKLMVTGMFNQDWAYPILDDNDDWGNDNGPGKDGRHFKESRSELALLSNYEDYLKECHVTWTPESWNIRVGKQVINWGRMDGRTVLNQINPQDVRRGISDVEYETRLMPIWLTKAEYYPGLRLPGIDDYGLEFIFNPNADFMPNKSFSTGNDVHGIWGVDALNSGLRVGSRYIDTPEPDSWDSDGYEYAFRFKGTLKDGTYFTLNYFDGIANSPVMVPVPVLPPRNLINPYYTDDKGRPIVQPASDGYYGDQKYAGFSFTHDLKTVYVDALGGVAPVIRCEGLYGFDSEFRSDGFSAPNPYGEKFEKHDEIYWGIGLDWKFKWNLLNPRRFISLGPEFSQRHILDYPDDYKLRGQRDGSVTENHYIMSVMTRTAYLHDKLEPMIFWMRDVQGNMQGDMWLFKLKYLPNSTWSYSAALTLLQNEMMDTVEGFGQRGLGHKDNLAITVQYQF
jgi:hypothetical protein